MISPVFKLICGLGGKLCFTNRYLTKSQENKNPCEDRTPRIFESLLDICPKNGGKLSGARKCKIFWSEEKYFPFTDAPLLMKIVGLIINFQYE